MIRVLVVEDDAGVRKVMVRMLQEAGYEVLEAADGHAGQAQVQAGGFDVLVSDVSLPGPHGLELAEKARAADPRFPVVLMTGHVQEEAQARIAHGDFDVLRKPFEPHQLLSAIAATLEQRRARAR